MWKLVLKGNKVKQYLKIKTVKTISKYIISVEALHTIILINNLYPMNNLFFFK